MSRAESKPDSAAFHYAGAAGREYHEGKRALAPGALDWVMRLRAEKFQPWVHGSDVVFELGVGSGWNLGRLNCARKLGADAADFLAESVRLAGIEFIVDPGRLPAGSIDVAICHHTLEHLAEPLAALHQLRRLLKPAGTLVLHVPWEREARYGRYHAAEPNHHLYSWNVQTLGNLISLVGFQIEQAQVRRYGYDRFAANLAAKFHIGARGFRLMRTMLVTLRPLREVAMIVKKP